MKVLIIIPAYNEAKTIAPVLDALSKPPISNIADAVQKLKELMAGIEE